MDEKNAGLIAAIEIAMEAEMKANKFYLDAKAKTANPSGKNLLQQLADFEKNHYDMLEKLRTSLAGDGGYIDYEGTDFSDYKKEAASEVEGSIEDKMDEVVKILEMAIDAESKAAQRYRQLAEETSDPKGKEMFKKLSEEETLHRRILSDEFYQLSNKGGIWMWGE